MKMNIDSLLKRVDELISEGEKVLSTKYKSYEHTYIKDGPFRGFRTASLSFLLNMYGKEHPYYRDFDKKVIEIYPEDTEQGIWILKSVKPEMKGGWLTTFKGLVSAEIFSNFIEMAEYLLTEDYKDSAAVMVGSVLEEHLRQLSIKNDVPIEFEKDGKMFFKKADKLNSELASKGIYNKLDQKNITTQLDIRNNAAHGHYSEYTKSQVEIMLQAVTDFISRVPL